MKTAISLPDDTYERATRQAAELGISRSEFGFTLLALAVLIIPFARVAQPSSSSTAHE